MKIKNIILIIVCCPIVIVCSIVAYTLFDTGFGLLFYLEDTYSIRTKDYDYDRYKGTIRKIDAELLTAKELYPIVFDYISKEFPDKKCDVSGVIETYYPKGKHEMKFVLFDHEKPYQSFFLLIDLSKSEIRGIYEPPPNQYTEKRVRTAINILDFIDNDKAFEIAKSQIKDFDSISMDIITISYAKRDNRDFWRTEMDSKQTDVSYYCWIDAYTGEILAPSDFKDDKE